MEGEIRDSVAGISKAKAIGYEAGYSQEEGFGETLEGGWNVLVGADKRKIIEAVQSYSQNAREKDIFGGSG